MRKAGITLGVQEVESVMTELDEQMREVQDITSVLSNPLQTPCVEDAELDAELELLDAIGTREPDPVGVNSMIATAKSSEQSEKHNEGSRSEASSRESGIHSEQRISENV